ncbi:pyridoxal phosphate-dependent transferase [Aspergillus cavernicola]|uniref:Aspartate aminotransferase n=1 Tax=Aspergillus cavernicola TaxID=176166 RepID=A0ABR4HHA7_9EURO
MSASHELDFGTSRFSILDPPSSGGMFALDAEYRADQAPQKVNLLMGAYRDDQGQPWQLSSVTEAKTRMNLHSCHHEYLPIHGNPVFLEAAREVLFGHEISEHGRDSIVSIQTISGTGANSLIAAFLNRHTMPSNIWLPDPTWMNHFDIWQAAAPGIKVQKYPYYDGLTRSFDFAGMMRILRSKSSEHDAILLHACAHNPTGLDPSEEQWEEIALFCKEKMLFVIFDSAYQGFASGDLNRDAWPVRHFFTHRPIEFAVCQSFSKNLGLYGERVGALHVVVSRETSLSASLTAPVQGHLVDLQRAMVSMPPLFGCRVATEILKSTNLQRLWKMDLLVMSERIKDMRKALYNALVRLKTPGTWEHITEQNGMFSYTGLSEDHVSRLRKEHHVYMLPTGRASICGLTAENIGYTAYAIHRVVVDELAVVEFDLHDQSRI